MVYRPSLQKQSDGTYLMDPFPVMAVGYTMLAMPYGERYIVIGFTEYAGVAILRKLENDE